MIILTKKKIIYTLGIIAMFVFAYMITGYNIKHNNKNEIKTIQTVALPVNNRVIIIDAGHGVPDERSSKFKTEQQKLRVI